MTDPYYETLLERVDAARRNTLGMSAFFTEIAEAITELRDDVRILTKARDSWADKYCATKVEIDKLRIEAGKAGAA